MQMNQEQAHQYLPFVYCCSVCGDVFHSIELIQRDAPHTCPKCDTEDEPAGQLCQWCHEPCDPCDILCVNCKDTVVCYAEMPAPHSHQDNI